MFQILNCATLHRRSRLHCPVSVGCLKKLSVSRVDVLIHWHWLPARDPLGPLGSRGQNQCGVGLTWVFSTTTSLDEAHDEQDQDDEGDGTHQADEPALSGDVHLVDVGCGRRWRRSRGDSGTVVGNCSSGLDVRQHLPRLGLSAAAVMKHGEQLLHRKFSSRGPSGEDNVGLRGEFSDVHGQWCLYPPTLTVTVAALPSHLKWSQT